MDRYEGFYLDDNGYWVFPELSGKKIAPMAGGEDTLAPPYVCPKYHAEPQELVLFPEEILKVSAYYCPALVCDYVKLDGHPDKETSGHYLSIRTAVQFRAFMIKYAGNGH